MKCTGDFLSGSYSERNMRFGIREFGMGAVSNALSLDKTGLRARALGAVHQGMVLSAFLSLSMKSTAKHMSYVSMCRHYSLLRHLHHFH